MKKPHSETVMALLEKSGGHMVENNGSVQTWYFRQGVAILHTFPNGDWQLFRNWPLVTTESEITALLAS